MSQVSYILPISSCTVTYKVVVHLSNHFAEVDSSISPLQDTIRPSRRPPYSSLYRTLPGKRMVHEASQMGVLSLLKVEFDGDSTVLLCDEVHLAI